MADGTHFICYESAITASSNKNNLERRRGIHRRRRSVDQNGGLFRRGRGSVRRRGGVRRGRHGVRRRRGVRWRRQGVRRRRSVRRGRQSVLQLHRKEHMVRESGLVGAGAAHVDAAALTAGHRCPVGQRHRGVATVPSDDQGVGRGPVLEPARQQRGFFVSGIESIPENWPIGCGIRDPGRETRTIGPGGRISSRNIRRAGNLID